MESGAKCENHFVCNDENHEIKVRTAGLTVACSETTLMICFVQYPWKEARVVTCNQSAHHLQMGTADDARADVIAPVPGSPEHRNVAQRFPGQGRLSFNTMCVYL